MVLFVLAVNKGLCTTFRTVMEGVTLAGGPSTDIVLVCTNNTRMDGGLGLTITGMRNVTIKTEDASKEYTGAFYGALKVTDCH